MNNYLKKRRLHPSILELAFSLPKTIWFNLKVLPFKVAIKLPWVCSEASILKNAYLPDGSVLAYKSILTKKITDKSGKLFAGIPAKVIKEDINWEI